VSLTPIELEDTIVVIGAGMIGLLTLQAARLAGAGKVIVVDVDDTRLQLAQELGAAHTLNSKSSKSSLDLLEFTSGRGAAAVLECVGTSGTVKLAVDMVRKGGTVTLVGNIAPTIEFELQSAVTRQIRLQGSCASSGEYPACISLMSRGAIRVEPLISVVAPLEDGPMWFQRLYKREPGLLKVVLRP
jgi:L-iditol 2-dehydrogenase